MKGAAAPAAPHGCYGCSWPCVAGQQPAPAGVLPPPAAHPLAEAVLAACPLAVCPPAEHPTGMDSLPPCAVLKRCCWPCRGKHMWGSLAEQLPDPRGPKPLLGVCRCSALRWPSAHPFRPSPQPSHLAHPPRRPSHLSRPSHPPRRPSNPSCPSCPAPAVYAGGKKSLPLVHPGQVGSMHWAG